VEDWLFFTPAYLRRLDADVSIHCSGRPLKPCRHRARSYKVALALRSRRRTLVGPYALPHLCRVRRHLHAPHPSRRPPARFRFHKRSQGAVRT
jgi:hypothetical protein